MYRGEPQNVAQRSVCTSETFRKAEIGQLESAYLVNEDIGRFQITVDNAKVVVAVLQRARQLLHEEHDLGVDKRLLEAMNFCISMSSELFEQYSIKMQRRLRSNHES